MPHSCVGHYEAQQMYNADANACAAAAASTYCPKTPPPPSGWGSLLPENLPQAEAYLGQGHGLTAEEVPVQLGKMVGWIRDLPSHCLRILGVISLFTHRQVSNLSISHRIKGKSMILWDTLKYHVESSRVYGLYP